MIAKVIVDISSSNVDKVFDYICPFDVKQGDEVLVPFGTRNISGIVIDITETSDVDKENLKEIKQKLDNGIPKQCIILAKFISRKYYTYSCSWI